MSVINCRSCGRLTLGTGEGFCPECSSERDRMISEIKDFLMKNRRAGVMEVVQGTNIPSRLVFEFIREGRIEVN